MTELKVVQVLGEDVQPGRVVTMVYPDGVEESFPVIRKGKMRLAIVPAHMLAVFLEVFDWHPEE